MRTRRFAQFAVAVALTLLLTASLWAAGTQQATAAEEVPEVHIWPTMSITDPNGSNTERMRAVQEYIRSQVGVWPVGYSEPHGPEFATKMNLRLASRTQRLDIFSGGWPQYKETALPLNDLLENYGPNVLAAFSSEQWAGVTDADGTIWGVPRLGLMGHTHFTWFNEAMFDDAGLDLPDTWDEMVRAFEVIKAADPNAIMLTGSVNDLRRSWAGAFTEYGYSRWLDRDGTLQPPEFQPGYRDFVATMADWYRRGWLFRENFVAHDRNEVFRAGNVAIYSGWYSGITIHLNRILVSGALPGVDYSFTEGFSSDKGLVMTNNASPDAAIMISRRSENPEAAMRLMNWQFDPEHPENVVTAVYGIQGEDWEWADPNEKYFVRRLRTDPGTIYAGELMVATGLATDVLYAPDDPELRRHYVHIRDYVFDLSNGKTPVDFDVTYDMSRIRNAVESFDDIQRMIDEETVKFITGARPMAQWSQFLDELRRIGIDQLYEEYTSDYRAAKGL